MKKIWTLTFIFSFLILSVAVVFAQPPQRMPGARRMFDRPQNRILGVLQANKDELNITDEQMERVQNIVFSFKEKAVKRTNENRLNRLELQKLMQDREHVDYDEIEAILAKTASIRNELFIDGLKLREEISNVLTPEQRETLKAIAGEGIRSRARNLRDRLPQRFPGLRNRIRR